MVSPSIKGCLHQVKVLPSAARGLGLTEKVEIPPGERGGEGEELPEGCALGFSERSHPFSSLPTAMLPSLLSQLSRVCRFKVQGLSLRKDTPSYSLLNPARGSHFFCSHPQFMEPVFSCQQRPPLGLLSVAFHPSLSEETPPPPSLNLVPSWR